MKNLRFAIAALIVFGAFSLYLIGMNEADDPYVIAAFSLLPIMGSLLLASDKD